MRFQAQVFQSEGEAAGAYDPDAKQKTGYVAGEQLWYKNSLVNVPKRSNTGITTLEGELYNPVFYEMIPAKYLKNASDGTIDAAWLASRLHVSWVENARGKTDGTVVEKDKDVYAQRTNGMKLIVEPVADYTLPDYGGAMIYTNTYGTTQGGHGNYFADLDPRGKLGSGDGAVNVSQDTTFTLLKILNTAGDPLPAGAVEASRTADAAGKGGSVVNPDFQYDRPVDELMPDSTRMEVGDRIELYFDVYASVSDLPQVYQRSNIIGDQVALGQGTSGMEPAYFRRGWASTTTPTTGTRAPAGRAT